MNKPVARRGTTDDDVIAAAGASMAAIEHEFFGAETRLTRLLVQRRGVRNEIVPRVRRVKIDFDHARIGRDGEVVQTRIDRRLFTLDDDRHAQRRGGALECRKQIEVILRPLDRRHEHMQPALSRLDADRRANHAGIGHATLWRHGLATGRKPDAPV
jgi:hypothetical protein